jgi:hypothetical protein
MFVECRHSMSSLICRVLLWILGERVMSLIRSQPHPLPLHLIHSPLRTAPYPPSLRRPTPLRLWPPPSTPARRRCPAQCRPPPLMASPVPAPSHPPPTPPLPSFPVSPFSLRWVGLLGPNPATTAPGPPFGRGGQRPKG